MVLCWVSPDDKPGASVGVVDCGNGGVVCGFDGVICGSGSLSDDVDEELEEEDELELGAILRL